MLGDAWGGVMEALEGWLSVRLAVRVLLGCRDGLRDGQASRGRGLAWGCMGLGWAQMCEGGLSLAQWGVIVGRRRYG
jgi:hypothetical protein